MKKVKSIILFMAFFFVTVTFAGCSKTNDLKDGSKNKDRLVFTAGENKVYLDEMMYYILIMESEYNNSDQMYQALYGKSVWDLEENGVLFRDLLKDETLATAQTIEIMYQEAVKAGLTLSDEDKAELDKNVQTTVDAITEEQLKVTGLNKELITKIVEKMILANRYRDEILEKADINEEEIKEGIPYEEYRQYNSQSIYISKTKLGDDGQVVALTEEEQKEKKARLEDALKEAKKGTDLAAIVEGDDQLSFEENETILNEEEDEEFKKIVSSLKNNEISEIAENEEQYYFVKMINDNASDSYNEVIDNSIETKQMEIFSAEYEKIQANYNITVNEEIWDQIVMGKMTIEEVPKTESEQGEAPNPEIEVPEEIPEAQEEGETPEAEK